MKYIHEYRNDTQVKTLVRAIRQAVTRPWHLMEICGGQTHALARYRLEEMLPPELRLLHGPGCPVCVTPIETIDRALEIAALPDVIFTSFGDMMRVPGSRTDLLHAKAQGADVRLLYSPLDAVTIAEQHPEREVVFFAIGFETTAPVHLAALREALRRKVHNFSLLTSLFTVPPAIDAILSDPNNQVDGFLTAGHVCAITGNAPYHRLAEKYRAPMVVTGFEPVDLLYGIYRCVLQLEAGAGRVENAYKRAVPEEGNPAARALMEEMLEPCDCEWRGIGTLPGSGLRLRKEWEGYSALHRFPTTPVDQAAPTPCIAGDIMRGHKQPSDCPCFRTTCHPSHPLGAPMVSAEGVCAAYYKYR